MTTHTNYSERAGFLALVAEPGMTQRTTPRCPGFAFSYIRDRRSARMTLLHGAGSPFSGAPALRRRDLSHTPARAPDAKVQTRAFSRERARAGHPLVMP